jgi:hypothetical protein
LALTAPRPTPMRRSRSPGSGWLDRRPHCDRRSADVGNALLCCRIAEPAAAGSSLASFTLAAS